MRNQDLLAIMDLLPESCLERAIKDCLYQLFILHDWEPFEIIIKAIPEKCVGRNLLLAEITVIAVQFAVKNRNIPLAISRFKKISSYGNSQEFFNLKADALFHLGAALLPEQPTQLKKLWESCLGDKLSFHAQRLLVQIGLMAARQYIRNSDIFGAHNIYQTMKNTLDTSSHTSEFKTLENLLFLK